MNKKNYLIGIIGIILIMLLLIWLVPKSEEKYFKPIIIDNSNIVFNFTDRKYIDTIVYVGLKELNINGINVIVQNLSENSKDKVKEFGELKAHIHELDDEYYIFIDNLGRDETIKILSHELIHLSQYYKNELILIEFDKVFWKNDTLTLSKLDYLERPFEIDAYRKQNDLKLLIEKQLY